jgi:hypothetical protein
MAEELACVAIVRPTIFDHRVRVGGEKTVGF